MKKILLLKLSILFATNIYSQTSNVTTANPLPLWSCTFANEDSDSDKHLHQVVFKKSNNIGFDSCGKVVNALHDFQAHLNGKDTLSSNELILIKNTFIQYPKCLAEKEAVILLAKRTIEDYDAKIGPLFTTPNTSGFFYKDTAASPGRELERAMIALQQGIFDHVFTPKIYEAYPQHINGWKFNSCKNFPGDVAPPADSSLSRTVPIRANFEDPDGMNPFLDLTQGDALSQGGLTHALRPTGLYLAPGSVVSVTVPDSLVGQDYWVRVGSHDWDLTEKPRIRRIDRISKRFPINSKTIQVFNPLGGAISILVPYGANDSIVNVSLNNGVEAPFFSLKTFYETQDYEAEMNKPGPWAVFESDNVMYTIPKVTITPGKYDLKKALQDWDTSVKAVNSILVRAIIPDKHTMYMIADLDIRHSGNSIGYPMSNTPLYRTSSVGPTYFIDGPDSDDETNFHEAGHSFRLSQFPGEQEALVNLPYVMAMNYGLKKSLNEAVRFSSPFNAFDIDKTATLRMVSKTFGSERDISNTVTNEVRYQQRGYGHYFEIVNILGWCPLRNFWKQEFIDFKNTGIDYVLTKNIDSRIIRMSVAAQADLRPLFHVFGILPQDSIMVQDTMVQLGIKPSLAIYNRLEAYFDLIPKDSIEFVKYGVSVQPKFHIEKDGWLKKQSLTYNEAEAKLRKDILQSIIDRYFPNGKPTDNAITDVCCLLDTMKVSMVNKEVKVTGGVAPYNITTKTIGSTQTVTVVDYDGCESTIQLKIVGLSEPNIEGIKIYPNPASTEINIDLTESSEQIERVQIVSIHGQVMKQYQNDNRVIDISMLSEGTYILQIKLTSGKQINKRVIVLK